MRFFDPCRCTEANANSNAMHNASPMSKPPAAKRVVGVVGGVAWVARAEKSMSDTVDLHLLKGNAFEEHPSFSLFIKVNSLTTQ